MHTPESVPKAVVVTSSVPKNSAFLLCVTPRLVRKQAVPSSVTPSASRSDITVDRLIGSRELDSEIMLPPAARRPRMKRASTRDDEEAIVLLANCLTTIVSNFYYHPEDVYRDIDDRTN
jgi:hypothetical protein